MLRAVALCLLTVSLVAAAEPAGVPVLDETFEAPHPGWLVDDFSRFEDGRYVIDARGEGGYYRWLEQPADLGDIDLSLQVEKARGNNAGPLYGVIFRMQDGWQNSYFFGINGSATYYFGKFVGGSPVVLKQATARELAVGGGRNTLGVRARGTNFGLSLNGQPVANVADDTFPAPGRVGLFVEAPAMVRFDNLKVARLAAEVGPPVPLAGPRTIFVDSFDRPTGWAEDEFRAVAGGEYHLRNPAEPRSFVSWQPAVGALTDASIAVDARQREAAEGQLFGVCWRVVDGAHYYFFLINPDGRYLAGVRDGGRIEVAAEGTQAAIRAGGEANTLAVRAEGSTFRLSLNGQATAEFQDTTLRAGAVGVYLEPAGHASFDNLLVTDLPENAPPLVGAGGDTPSAWPAGAVTYHEPLTAAGGAPEFLVDDTHRYDQGGYCLLAPEEGSETILALPTMGLRDGIWELNVRAVDGPVGSTFGLVFRADPQAGRFYYLLVTSVGRYVVGACIDGQFETIDSGPVTSLRGGDAGQDLQVRAEGSAFRFAINGRELGGFRDERLAAGAVGIHAENGVTACFRDLRVRSLPGG